MTSPAQTLLRLPAATMALALALSCAQPASADLAQDRAIVAEAKALVGKGRGRQAAALLSPLVPAYAGDPDFNALYGVALIDSGRPQEAAAALRRALAARPDHALARIQLGRALAAANDLAGARREIALVSGRSDLSPAIRGAMARNLAAIDEAAARAAAAKANPPVGPQPNAAEGETIRKAAELVRARKSGEARELLAPYGDRFAGNPEVDYLVGVAALDAGRPGEAAVALRRALEARPTFQPARAELGRALVAMGDLPAARREYAAAQAGDGVPPIVRDALGRQIVSIDELVASQGRTRVTGYMEAAGGYDTNVNLGPSSSTLLVPALAFLGPATISRDARPKSSGFGEMSGGLSIAQPLADGWSLFANLTGSGRLLFRHEEFDTGQGGIEGGVAKIVEGLGTFSVAGIGQQLALGGTANYRTIHGAAALWQNRFAEAWETTLTASWLRIGFPHIEGLDADRFTVTGIVGRRFDLGLPVSVSLTVNGGVEETLLRIADFQSFSFVGTRLNVDVALAPGLVAFVQAGGEFRRYDADFPLFSRRRADDVAQVVGGLEIKLTQEASLRPSVSWFHTVSNVGIYTSDRTIGSLAFRVQF